jgi:DNA polymerase-3 subunit beta
MKAQIDKSALLAALSRVQRIVERRNTIPILGHILLRCDAQGIVLQATDLDVDVRDYVAADVAEEGAIAVPAHLFYDVVRKLPDDVPVTLEKKSTESYDILLTAGEARFTFSTLAADTFPSFSEEDTAPATSHFTLPSHHLKRLLDKVKHAMSLEETRPYLNGIHLHKVENGEASFLRAVATDGHRLALASLPLPTSLMDLPGVIIPRKTVLEVERLLETSENDVTLKMSSKKTRFSIPVASKDKTTKGASDEEHHVTLTSKLVDGLFPEYERVIPRNNSKVLRVNKELLGSTVDRVATLSPGEMRIVKLRLSPSRLVVSTLDNNQVGCAEESLSVNYTDQPLDIAFNARYLLDIVSVIDGEEIECHFSGPGASTLIQGTGHSDTFYVLMPMRA